MFFLPVNAASFAAASTADSSFVRFAIEVQGPRNMSPFETWLVPDWMTMLKWQLKPKEQEETVTDDEYLQYLDNPTIILAEERDTCAIAEYLRDQSRRIKRSYQFARSHLEGQEQASWLTGLKEYSAMLVKNAQEYAIFKEINALTHFGVLSTASVAGLLWESFDFRFPTPFFHFVRYIPNLIKVISGVASKTDGYILSLLMALLLDQFQQIDESRIEYYGKLTSAMIMLYGACYFSNHFVALYRSLVEMAPVGRKIFVGFGNLAEGLPPTPASTTSPASIVEMMKGEDGYIYGLKYTINHATEPPCLAFRITIASLKDALDSEFKLENLTLHQEIQHPWFQKGKVPDSANLVYNYAQSWDLDLNEPIRIGAIWLTCQLLSHRKEHKKEVKRMLKMPPGTWTGMAMGISKQSAALLLSKLLQLAIPEKRAAAELLKDIIDGVKNEIF